MQNIVGVGGINGNVSPYAFHRWATHYLICRRCFRCPDKFSPVPYFLLCRAIELEIKSRLLKHMKQNEVKQDFGHDLVTAYNALNPDERILEENEEHTLKVANVIYDKKDFEYFNPEDALTGYHRFPNLEELDSMASKLVGI